MVEGFEMMERVHMAVLPVSMIIETAQYDRSAGTTGCRSTKAMGKSCAVLGQKVQPWRLDHGITVTAGVIGSLVIYDNYNNVWLLPSARACLPVSALADIV